METPYIADIIGEEYKEWDSSKPIIIHAPMGSGKTYFVLNVLLPYVHSRGKKLVYLANRVALEKQVKHDIPDEYRNSIITCSYQQLAYFYSIQRKIEMTQKKGMIPDQKVVKKAQKMDEIASADYYILDEAHYFLADANFNTEIKDCLEVLKDFTLKGKDHISVFMTGTINYLLLQLQWSDSLKLINNSRSPATGVDSYIPILKDISHQSLEYNCSVKALLTYKETRTKVIRHLEAWQVSIHPYELPADFGNSISFLDDQIFYSISQETGTPFMPIPESNKCHSFQKYFQERLKRITYSLYQGIESNYHLYTLPQDFSYVTPIYFHDWEEIIAAITRTPQEEKWIIFVSNESDGDVLLQKMMENGCTDAVFLTAKRRRNQKLLEYKVFQEIVENASFHQRVLITTKVLDNGINLKDESLKHMAIGTFDETTFLQIVGRKRRMQQSDRLKLYLKDASEGTIQKQFENHILQIIIFWHELSTVQNLNFDKDSTYSKSRLRRFILQYTKNGRLQYPFYKYVVQRDLPYHGKFRSLADIYRPAEYPK